MGFDDWVELWLEAHFGNYPAIELSASTGSGLPINGNDVGRTPSSPGGKDSDLPIQALDPAIAVASPQQAPFTEGAAGLTAAAGGASSNADESEVE